jgi:hypothetical protein
VLGLVAPHIDLQAGGITFAHAYKAAMEASFPQTWVILGTGHEPAENLFALTLKDFETPLGMVPCDRDFCHRLVECAPRDLQASEYNHRREHTIEFQAVFLSWLQPEARIVPLLCSFSHQDWETEHDYIDRMAEILAETAALHARSVGFLASVDLAHIGPRYGDGFTPHRGTVAEHMAADGRLLELLEACRPSELIGELCRDHNRRRVCGLAPLYVLARVLQGKAVGHRLHHSSATVDHQHSFVTFASMIFYQNDG